MDQPTEPLVAQPKLTGVVTDKHMPVMTLPVYEDIEFSVRNSAVNLFNNYQRADRTSASRVLVWLDQAPVITKNIGPFSLEDLEHPLSAYMLEARVQRDDVVGTTPNELEAFSIVRKRTFAAALRKSPSYIHMIEETAKIMMGSDTKIRTASVRTKPDITGRRIIYPAWKAVRPGLEELGTHTAQYYGWYPGFAALVTLISLLNLHPLRGGNGRLSRLMFNWMLNGERHEPVYLPISELALISNFGLLLRIREAQYFNKWKGIAAFMEMATDKLFGCE